MRAPLRAVRAPLLAVCGPVRAVRAPLLAVRGPLRAVRDITEHNYTSSISVITHCVTAM